MNIEINCSPYRLSIHLIIIVSTVYPHRHDWCTLRRIMTLMTTPKQHVGLHGHGQGAVTGDCCLHLSESTLCLKKGPFCLQLAYVEVMSKDNADPIWDTVFIVKAITVQHWTIYMCIFPKKIPRLSCRPPAAPGYTPWICRHCCV